MKLQIIVFVQLILVNLSCTSQVKSDTNNDTSIVSQKNNKIDKITMTEQTRGTNKSITYLASGITISINGTEKKSSISPIEWENIMKEANILDLSKIPSYESLTTDRFSDKALASKIIITSGKNTYKSSAFDEGIPPKELEKLYRLLKNKSGVGKIPKIR